VTLDEALREIERREELIAGADHQNAQLEAQAAAMREALKSWRCPECRGAGRYETICRFCGDSTYDHDCVTETRDCCLCAPIRTALAPDAGKALLERLQRVEEDRYDKVQALAAVSTLLCSSQEVPDSWDRYGAVQDARAANARVAALSAVEAGAAAMREALESVLLGSATLLGDGQFKVRQPSWSESKALCETALAPGAGKALLEWKQSAMTALGEWHQARELIGGAQLGDGPKEWAQRVLERLRKAEEHAYDEVQALAAVSTLLLSNQEVPESWNRYGAVQDARGAVVRIARAEAERDTKDRQVVALYQEREQLQRERDEARAVLKKTEWVVDEYPDYCGRCPMCNGYKPGKRYAAWVVVGHDPDCSLKKALGDGG
jgi:hypothetical protein